ncbi:MAG: AMP-binding protein, partial [Desulfobacterales bacterium]|nr:AMP-binding protein [Desulfobacterales bacterium]
MESRPCHRHYDYNVPTTIHYPRIPVQDFLGLAAKSFPKKTALSYFGSEITFWELRCLVMRFANALGALGIKKGDRVGLHLPNCPQYPIAYYAVLCLGGIVVNLNPLYTPSELQMMATTSGLTTLVTFDMALPAIRTLCQAIQIPRVIATAVTDYIQGFPPSSAKSLDLEKGWLHFGELLEKSTSTKIPKVAFSPDDPAVILFTGG